MPIHDWTRVHAGTFHAFHLSWIAELQARLNEGLLPDSYYAQAEQWVGGLGPDVVALEVQDGNELGNQTDGVAIALKTAAPRTRFFVQSEADEYARKARHLTIRHSSNDRVVSLIEIVSPGNKSSRHGVRAFVSKAVELLESGLHMLVIDLFPPSSRDPNGIHGLIWSELSDERYKASTDESLMLAAYVSDHPISAYLEPTEVGKSLIEMPLFLESDRYVNVPLEATYMSAYQAVPKRWKSVLEGPTQEDGTT
jgi:Protein of unknown function (DUF4058)